MPGGSATACPLAGAKEEKRQTAEANKADEDEMSIGGEVAQVSRASSRTAAEGDERARGAFRGSRCVYRTRNEGSGRPSWLTADDGQKHPCPKPGRNLAKGFEPTGQLGGSDACDANVQKQASYVMETEPTARHRGPLRDKRGGRASRLGRHRYVGLRCCPVGTRQSSWRGLGAEAL